MGKLVVLSGALAILSVATGGSAAQANSLSAGTGFVQCTTTTGLITDPVSCNGGTDSGLVTYAPFAGVSGRAFGEGLVEEAGVFGVLNYSFEVTGGNPGTVVPVDINTTLQAMPISIGYAFSEIGVTAINSAGVTICSNGLGCTGQTSFTGTLQVNALSGAVNTVHLEIEVIGALGNASDFNGGMASADPYIYIAPTFNNADGYGIEVSSQHRKRSCYSVAGHGMAARFSARRGGSIHAATPQGTAYGGCVTGVCLLKRRRSSGRAPFAGSAGARPDHPINGSPQPAPCISKDKLQIAPARCTVVVSGHGF